MATVQQSASLCSSVHRHDGPGLALRPLRVQLTTLPPLLMIVLGMLGAGCAAEVTPGSTIETLAITPADISMPAGMHRQMTATATRSNHTTEDVTRAVTWSSSRPDIATIANGAGAGQLTAVSNGSVTISARLDSLEASTTVTITAAVLVTLAVMPDAPVLAAGTSQQLTAIGTYSDGSTHDLTTSATWSTDDATIASPASGGPAGTIDGLSPGQTTITATLDTVSGQSVVTVTAAQVASLAITPNDASVARGLLLRLDAIATFTDGTTQNVTSQVLWSATPSSIVSVSNQPDSPGEAYALAEGSATVMAALNDVTALARITVTPAMLLGLSIGPIDPSLKIGGTQQFTATGTYSDQTVRDVGTQVRWESSDPSVASISNADGSHGLATAAAAGTAIIRATLDSFTSETSLTVEAPALVSLAITPESAMVSEDSTQQFTATGTYEDGSTRDLTAEVAWDSSAPLVATISNDAGSQGLARALTAGSATLSATLSALTASAQLAVTPAPNVCGNGVIEGHEVCDDGNTAAGDGCRADCFGFERCGDGLVDSLSGEQCDDGNTAAGDGCSATCQLDAFVSRDPVLVSDTLSCNLASSNTGRKVAVDQLGRFYVVMRCGGTAYVSSSTDRGASWIGPVSTGIDNVSEVAIEGGTDGVAYVAAVTPDGRVVFSQTRDAGATWTSPATLGTGAANTQISMDAFGTAIYISVLVGSTPRIYRNFTLGEGPFASIDVVQSTVYLDVLVDHISGNVIMATDTPNFHIRISTDRAASFGPQADPPGVAYFSDWAGSNGSIYVTGRMTTNITVIPVQSPATSTAAGGLPIVSFTDNRAIDADALGNAYVVSGSLAGIRLDRLVSGAPAVLAGDARTISSTQGVAVVAALPANNGALVAYTAGTSIYAAVVVYP